MRVQTRVEMNKRRNEIQGKNLQEEMNRTDIDMEKLCI